ncbi:MAG: TonB-dependent receptor [Chlorobi bacterium]|nr:TonB-dependent receptor [Chlorobiota bacterium]
MIELHLRGFAVLIVTCALLSPLRAQVPAGSVRGTIRHWRSQEIATLSVLLQEASSNGVLARTKPDSAGRFVFAAVPLGTYNLVLVENGAALYRRRIAVQTPLPVTVELDTIGEYAAAAVIVETPAMPSMKDYSTTHWFLTAGERDNLPMPMEQRAIETVLLNTPGVVPDEDGRLHVRGESAQLHYMIDGIPITGNMTRVYSSLFNASAARSIDVLTGGIGAEYNADGIISITTKSGMGEPMFANASGGVGTFDSREALAELGIPLGRSAGLYAAANTMRTGRYLDPIVAGSPLHDDGESGSFLAKFDAAFNEQWSASVLGVVNSTTYAVPNRTSASRQDQRQQLGDYLLGVRTNVSLSSEALASVVLYTRRASAELRSSGMLELSPAEYGRAIAENDKFFIGSRRRYQIYGTQLLYSRSLTVGGSDHMLTIGINGETAPASEYLTLAVTDSSLSSAYTAGGDARLAPYDITRGGTPLVIERSARSDRWSAFASDVFSLSRWTVRFGIRADYYRILSSEWSISPRIGVAYAAAGDLILRASYGHMFLPPPIENYLVSSSEAARTLAGSQQENRSSVVQAERSHVFEVGATYRPLPYLELDICGYAKLIRHFLVEVELSNSGIIFPANLRQGLVAGAELRMRLAEWHGISGFLWLSTCTSRGLIPEDGSSPFEAGLVIGEEGNSYAHPFSGEDSFPTEHDQLLTAAFAVRYAVSKSLMFIVGGRFDSGLPFDLTGPNGEPLDADQSAAELRRRGYDDKTISLLDLEPEMPGSPDRRVKPHATFDIMARYDLQPHFGLPLSVSLAVVNVFDTPYLYKFESTFGSTHYGLPRCVRLGCRVGL